MSKAFEHDLLFSKLERGGVRGTALNWFKSYLNDQKLFVDYNGYKSDEYTITYGCPQGSVLGPINI